MKKIILIFLFVLNFPTHASWIEVGSTTSGKFLILYDPDSINRVKNIVTIKILKNFKDSSKSVDAQKPYLFLSQVSIREIDCTLN